MMDPNTYENNEKELEGEYEAFEEDVDLKEATYQVWILGYNADDEFVEEHMLDEFTDPDPAMEAARHYFENNLTSKIIEQLNPETAYVNLLVETVVDLGDYDENVGTLFDEHIIIKR